MNINEARSAYNSAVERMNESASAIEAAPADADIDALASTFDTAKAEVERSKRQLDRIEAIAESRAAFTPVDIPSEPQSSQGEVRYHPVAKGSLKQESTYRPDNGTSFFRDLVKSNVDRDAAERLHRHTLEMRDVTTTNTTSGGGFIPPVYLGNLYAELPRAGRPFADALPRLPLPATGMTVSIPRITTGTAAAVQATENNAVQETDLVSTQLDVPVVTIAGLNDVSKQLFDRSDPGIDQIIFADLRADYDAKLDTQLISGSGSTGYHTGIASVSSINTVTYTDASPTAAELLPKVYDAIQKVWSNRYDAPTHIVMHPRRAAWLASNLSSTFSLFQQGGLYQGVGTQANGLVGMFAGLPVISDPNITTTSGSSTNEDVIYVVRASDMPLMEGPLQADTFPDTGSGSLTVRLRLFAYSAFASGRQPKSITTISGTGLAAPTF